MSTQTSSNTHRVTVEADPAVPIIRITRDFHATPAQLIRAHIDPDIFARGVGPEGMRTEIRHWDARTGGSWSYIGYRDEFEAGFFGAFHEIREDRIIQTFCFEGAPDAVALETMTFEDVGNGVTRLHAQSLVDSFEGRDAWLASGMETGVDEGYAALERLLADDEAG